MKQLSFLWLSSSRFTGLILSLVCFLLCYICKTMRHWAPCPPLDKMLSREVRVPDIQSNTLLTKPHGLFSSALRWTTRLFLTQTPLIPFPGYTPTCFQSQVLLDMWLFLECLVTLELGPLVPEQEDLRRQIPTMRNQCAFPSPQTSQSLWFSATASCYAQLTRSRNPSL